MRGQVVAPLDLISMENHKDKHQLLRCKNVKCPSRWWSRDVLGTFILQQTNFGTPTNKLIPSVASSMLPPSCGGGFRLSHLRCSFRHEGADSVCRIFDAPSVMRGRNPSTPQPCNPTTPRSSLRHDFSNFQSLPSKKERNHRLPQTIFYTIQS
jgi:hypothetical protein